MPAIARRFYLLILNHLQKRHIPTNMPTTKTRLGFRSKSQKEKTVEAQKQALDGFAVQRAGTSNVRQQANAIFSNPHAVAASARQSSAMSGAVVHDTSAAPTKSKTALGHKVLSIVNTPSTVNTDAHAPEVSKSIPGSKVMAAHQTKTVVDPTQARGSHYVDAPFPAQNAWAINCQSDMAMGKLATKVMSEPLTKVPAKTIPKRTQEPGVEKVAQELVVEKAVHEPARKKFKD
jgi:hypothetical protein